jgi:hypothetical protein
MMAGITDGLICDYDVVGDHDSISSLEDSNNDSLSSKDFQMTSDEMELDGDDLAILGDNGLVESTEERSVETNFCSSVRSDTPYYNGRHFNGPTYKERMVGLSTMIQSWCGTNLSSLTTIAHVSKWKIFKSDCFPLSVTVMMKDLEGITIAHFVECYERMETLYNDEKLKEGSKKKKLNFHDYCEELIGFWALMDMTLTMLVSEEGNAFISVMDLLEFATTRLHFVSVIERLVLHHFQDVDPGGGGRAFRRRRVNAEEKKLLAEYRLNVKKSGEKDVEYPLNFKLSFDNVNYALLLQLLCVQKQYKNSSKSSKRNLDKVHEDSAKLNKQANNDVFLQAVQSFCDHLIARLKNQPTDQDMMGFIISELELVICSYRKNKTDNV